ncbi:hypothetical protein [Capnocytophaga canis]|uniref:Uncharacterized protein n=1 Tax=Capnocytophaga canis TaxID=1848903 RepID=A0A0B7IPH3_9FLAO|nr:hypothetical protein [Capnocytophaga canis]CEN51932.1 conserved hypothetical protein [Capnocytophaga canis]
MSRNYVSPQPPFYGPGYAPVDYQPAPFYPYSRSYSQGNYQSYRGEKKKYKDDGKKKSGAKEVHGTTKDGNRFFGVVGWFYRQNVGLVNIKAFENSKSTHYTTQQGKEGIALMFEVTYRDSGVKRLEIAPYSFVTGKAFLKETGIVISTRVNNGGYAGFYSNKRRK